MADYINFLSGALQINTVSYELKRVGILFCCIFCQNCRCQEAPFKSVCVCGGGKVRGGSEPGHGAHPGSGVRSLCLGMPLFSS